MRYTPALLIFFLITGCTAGSSDVDPAQAVVDRAIAWQGGEILNNAHLSFDFRGRHFNVRKQNGMFSYERTYVDTTGARIREVLSNDGLIRERNGQLVQLDSAAYASAETSVNSVVYFALLPLPLNDPAAQKRLLGTTELNGATYDELEVTFTPEGGGRDHDDRFIYWINQETGSMDYLAYYYHVNETGARFREAYNVRQISGVRIADFHNYKVDGITIDTVEDFDSLHAAGQTVLVSDIELENVRVVPLAN